MTTKKGVLYHWIMFGILSAIAIFLALTKGYTFQQEPVGEWHLKFIANTLQQAEIDLLEMDQKARDAGWEVALLLAKQGWFKEASECGKVVERNIWNNKEKWCLPVVKSIAGELIDAKIAQKEITFSEETMYGFGEKKVIANSSGKLYRYEYSSNIAINLGYNFDEYTQLEQEARSLVRTCGSASDLVLCIDENKRSHWQLCEEGVIDNVGVFCVNSPNNYSIRGAPVIYEFGLRFE